MIFLITVVRTFFSAGRTRRLLGGKGGGIGIGAAIYGYVPEDALAGLMGKWWRSVLLVVLIARPPYSNAAGKLPVMGALIEKGAAMGTAPAFMMAVVGVSLPETILLRRVLKARSSVLFIGAVTVATIVTEFFSIR